MRIVVLEIEGWVIICSIPRGKGTMRWTSGSLERRPCGSLNSGLELPRISRIQLSRIVLASDIVPFDHF